MGKLREELEEYRRSDEYQETREKAVNRAHEFLMELENVGPLELTLFLSHCFSHLLMSAPEEEDLKEMLAIFMLDLDVADVVKDWKRMSAKEKQEEQAEAEIEGTKPSVH
jgi:hypothetical protein